MMKKIVSLLCILICSLSLAYACVGVSADVDYDPYFGGYNADLLVTNSGSSTLSSWCVELVDTNYSITSANATITTTGTSHVLCNLSWNGTIAPGQTLSVFFQGSTGGAGVQTPTHSSVEIDSVDGVMCGSTGGSTGGSVCSVQLGEQEEFEPAPVWTGQVVDGRETTLVGDVDGDGIPEVLADDYKNPGKIYVLDGVTGVTEHVIDTGEDLTQNNSSNAIADVDRNGYGEIYFVDEQRGFHRWDFDGTTWSATWTSPDLVGVAGGHDKYVPHLADFDGDGTPEIYMGPEIYRVSDGKKIGVPASAGYYPGDLGGSNAIDVLPDNYVFVDGPRAGTTCTDCQGLELAVGSRVFTIDIGAGTVTLATEDGTGYDGRGGDAVADMDNDGDVDIIYTRSIGGDAHVIVWDGQTSQQLMLVEVNDQRGGIGRPNIADFDGDGCNEIGVVSYRRYSVIDDVFADDAGCPGPDTPGTNTVLGGNILRFINNSDGSAVTGSSVFDFDLDGTYEVVYRDQTHLFILAGPDGAEKFKESCTSGTRRENPVIVDVNNDGATEIVVACNNVGIASFASATDPWAPSRPVWNQHGYNVTNVNDDLTIPAVPAYNPTRAGGAHDNFMTQSLPIDGDFVPTNDLLPPGHIFAADLVLDIDSVYTGDCAASMTITVDVQNYGDALAPASTPIQVYDGDPTIGAVSSLGAGIVGTTLGTGGAMTTVTLPVSSCTSPLFVVVNDGTTSTPYALSGSLDFPNTSTPECNYENNIDSILFSGYCGDGVIGTGEECDDGNAIANDGCSLACDIEYCRDDAPLHDTSKNFIITSLTPTDISGTSSQPNSQVAICLEDTTGTRDVFYTMTDAGGDFTFLPNFTPYLPNRVNVGIMLHDENGLDIDHHALVLPK